MRSIWREIESAIDKVVEKYAKDESSRERIENGEQSALYEKFGINFERTQKRWCFRSARANELDISYIGDTYIYPDRNDIEKFIVQMMSDVRSAINNTYDFVKECNRYSKYLAAPLFKFKNGNNPLIIDKLDLNTIDISVDVSCFDWIGEGAVSYDRFGNEQNRYHVEDCFFSIPFRELFSKSRIIEAIVDEIENIKDSRNGMMDVYDISALAFLNMTLDISAVDRPALDRFYNEYKGTKFFRYASYVKDWEVLSTRKNPSYDGMVIRDSRAVQLVRFIYLLKVANLYTGDICVFIRTSY